MNKNKLANSFCRFWSYVVPYIQGNYDIWTNAGMLLIGPYGTNFGNFFYRNSNISIQENALKLVSAKWCPFCLGLNVLTATDRSSLGASINYTPSCSRMGRYYSTLSCLSKGNAIISCQRYVMNNVASNLFRYEYWSNLRNLSLALNMILSYCQWKRVFIIFVLHAVISVILFAVCWYLHHASGVA